MKATVYLDNSATTPISQAARAAMAEAVESYGNPSSLHSMGQSAEAMLKRARESVLSGLGVRPRDGELIFTSCGTEATALALFGAAHAKERRVATEILISDAEHPSVKNTAYALEREGFEVVEIPTVRGVLDMAAIERAMEKRVFLASFMLVNNETGARFSVGEAFAKIKARYPDAITHCDAVQAFMKVPFTPASLKADMITVSGHKLHAPKGVGALYVSADMIKKKNIVPYLYGGGQEKGMRSGTENTVGIAAFGAAVADIKSRLPSIRTHLGELYGYARERLLSIGVRVNAPEGARVDHIINVIVAGIKSETLLHFLSADGVFVSSGSACSSHSGKPSEVLQAFGLSSSEADQSIRISFSEYNTKDDVDALIASLEAAMARLVRVKR